MTISSCSPVRHLCLCCATVLTFSGGAHTAAQAVVTQKQLSLALAAEAASAAVAQCRQDGFRASVVVLDRAGNIQVMLRDDASPLHALETSRQKAFTALSFGVPTSEFAQRTEKTPALRSIGGVTALPGGLPIRSGNDIIGAIGAGGAVGGERDERCAQAGIDKIKDRL